MTSNLFDSAATFQRGLHQKLAFVLLNQTDLVLTVLAVGLGLTEINPFMEFLLTAPALLVLFKVVIPFAIAWLVPGRLLVPAIILLGLVAAWNIKELLLFFFGI